MVLFPSEEEVPLLPLLLRTHVEYFIPFLLILHEQSCQRAESLTGGTSQRLSYSLAFQVPTAL